MAIEQPSLSELISGVLILSGLGLSMWAMADDVSDLVRVRRYGEIGGPRWVSAMEHFLFNGSLLFGWVCVLGLLSIAIYLPSRPSAVENELGTIGGWLRLGFVLAVLVAQINRRVGRQKMRSLPLAAWERMLSSMFDGLNHEQREVLSKRLLSVTLAGREMGHAINNGLAQPVGAIDLVLSTATLNAVERADLIEAKENILAVCERVSGLHTEIKSEGQPA